MNTIKALVDKSDYEIYADFLNFHIDDFWLDEKLEELYPNNMYKGLVPTLTFSVMREDEKEVVWDRILPSKNRKSICPILMCPDDCDFSCTTIVAEILNTGSLVKWLRIGIDKTQALEAEKVGSVVEWFEDIEEFLFTKENYLEMLDIFIIQFEKEKADYLKEEKHSSLSLYLPNLNKYIIQ